MGTGRPAKGLLLPPDEACVMFVVAGNDGDGKTSGFERKMKDVRIEVTMSEQERPGLERSRMYHRAGLTRARVRVSWRVDCQGRRRWSEMLVRLVDCYFDVGWSLDLRWRKRSPRKQLHSELRR